MNYNAYLRTSIQNTLKQLFPATTGVLDMASLPFAVYLAVGDETVGPFDEGSRDDVSIPHAQSIPAWCLLILTHRFLKCYMGYAAGVVLGSIILIGMAVDLRRP